MVKRDPILRDSPHEVWVSNELRSEAKGATYRSNAQFATYPRAREEVDWYVAHGYYADVRDSNDGYFEDVQEYQEGSGGR